MYHIHSLCKSTLIAVDLALHLHPTVKPILSSLSKCYFYKVTNNEQNSGLNLTKKAQL